MCVKGENSFSLLIIFIPVLFSTPWKEEFKSKMYMIKQQLEEKNIYLANEDLSQMKEYAAAFECIGGIILTFDCIHVGGIVFVFLLPIIVVFVFCCLI